MFLKRPSTAQGGWDSDWVLVRSIGVINEGVFIVYLLEKGSKVYVLTAVIKIPFV